MSNLSDPLKRAQAAAVIALGVAFTPAAYGAEHPQTNQKLGLQYCNQPAQPAQLQGEHFDMVVAALTSQLLMYAKTPEAENPLSEEPGPLEQFIRNYTYQGKPILSTSDDIKKTVEQAIRNAQAINPAQAEKIQKGGEDLAQLAHLYGSRNAMDGVKGCERAPIIDQQFQFTPSS